MPKNKVPERNNYWNVIVYHDDIPFDYNVAIDDFAYIKADKLIELLQEAIAYKEKGYINNGAYLAVRADEDVIDCRVTVKVTEDDTAYEARIAEWHKKQANEQGEAQSKKEAKEYEQYLKLKAKYEPKSDLQGAELDQMHKDKIQEEMEGEDLPIITPVHIFKCYEKSWIVQARIEKPGLSVVDIGAAGLLPLDMEHMRVSFVYDKLEPGIVYVGHQHKMLGQPCTGIILKIEGEVPQSGVNISINFIHK